MSYSSLLSEEVAQGLYNEFQSSLISCLRYPLVATIENELLSDIQAKSQRQTGKDNRGDRPAANNDREWTTHEEAVRDAFSRISGVTADRVNRTTTIYQLGLDSISAVQVAARLRKEGYSVSAVDILERPTTAQLASFLQSGEGSSTKIAINFDFNSFEKKYFENICKEHSIFAESVEAIRPCTFSQSGMMAEFFGSGGHTYLNYQRLELQNSFDIPTLQRAWKAVFQKHPMLRTGFVHITNSQIPFAMVTYRAFAEELPCEIRKGSTDGSEDISNWRQRIRHEVLQGCHRPAWRMLVSEHQGIVSLHIMMLHALYDAHSLRIILDDLAAACEGMQVPSPPAIESLLGHILSSSNQEDGHKQFWETRSQDIHIQRFPNMTPFRTKILEMRAVARECSTAMSELERRCREANISMQAAGQIAWARILSAYTGEPTVTFGVVLSGRAQDDAEAVPFPSITTVPFACRTHQSNRSLLDQTLDFNAAVQKHQFTPLSKIQKWSGYEGEALFDTIFVYQKSSHAAVQSSPWTVVDEEASANVSLYLQLHGDVANIDSSLCRSSLNPAPKTNLAYAQLSKLMYYHRSRQRCFWTNSMSC